MNIVNLDKKFPCDKVPKGIETEIQFRNMTVKVLYNKDMFVIGTDPEGMFEAAAASGKILKQDKYKNKIIEI